MVNLFALYSGYFSSRNVALDTSKATAIEFGFKLSFLSAKISKIALKKPYTAQVGVWSLVCIFVRSSAKNILKAKACPSINIKVFFSPTIISALKPFNIFYYKV